MKSENLIVKVISILIMLPSLYFLFSVIKNLDHPFINIFQLISVIFAVTIVGLFPVVSGIFLWQLKNWARITTLVIAYLYIITMIFAILGWGFYFLYVLSKNTEMSQLATKTPSYAVLIPTFLIIILGGFIIWALSYNKKVKSLFKK